MARHKSKCGICLAPRTKVVRFKRLRATGERGR